MHRRYIKAAKPVSIFSCTASEANCCNCSTLGIRLYTIEMTHCREKDRVRQTYLHVYMHIIVKYIIIIIIIIIILYYIILLYYNYNYYNYIYIIMTLAVAEALNPSRIRSTTYATPTPDNI